MSAAGPTEYVFGDLRVATTHLDRIVFPDAGGGHAIAKGEVVAYYHRVADVMVPELAGRPLTMERFTKGIDAGGFFQKHAQKHYPAWIDRREMPGKTVVTYPICNSPAALVYFANQGGVAFHVWTSKVDAPERPDLVVFDLDPPEGPSAGHFELVRKVARLLHELLGELALPAFVKTTGSKGLHVVAPVDGSAPFAEVDALCGAIAKRLCTRHPDLVTTEFYKKDRKGRLFFDTMRNAPGATFVAAYSLRGKPGAPVSAPITWTELDDPALRPDGFKLHDIAARLDRHGDPWAKLRAHPGSVAAAAAKLAKLTDSD